MELIFFILMLAMVFVFVTPHTMTLEYTPMETEPCRHVVVSTWGGSIKNFDGVICDGDSFIIEGKRITVPEGGFRRLDDLREVAKPVTQG